MTLPFFLGGGGRGWLLSGGRYFRDRREFHHRDLNKAKSRSIRKDPSCLENFETEVFYERPSRLENVETAEHFRIS